MSELENIVESELEVEKQYHEYFFAQRGQFLEKIKSECGGVAVTVPNKDATTVKLKGGKKDVEKVLHSYYFVILEF